jgi:ElaB/YqjD/DUF883 family membrane-anchored ribosome-binding protein
MARYKNRKLTNRYDITGDLGKIRDAFTETAKDVGGKASQVFTQSMTDVKDRSADIRGNVEEYVAEKPFKALILAMLSGAFIGGALMRKKKRVIRHYRE